MLICVKSKHGCSSGMMSWNVIVMRFVCKDSNNVDSEIHYFKDGSIPLFCSVDFFGCLQGDITVHHILSNFMMLLCSDLGSRWYSYACMSCLVVLLCITTLQYHHTFSLNHHTLSHQSIISGSFHRFMADLCLFASFLSFYHRFMRFTANLTWFLTDLSTFYSLLSLFITDLCSISSFLSLFILFSNFFL